MNGSDDIRRNQWINEWELWSMKVGAAKISNESNHTKIEIIKWEIIKILVSKIHTIFYENLKIEK